MGVGAIGHSKSHRRRRRDREQGWGRQKEWEGLKEATSDPILMEFGDLQLFPSLPSRGSQRPKLHENPCSLQLAYTCSDGGNQGRKARANLGSVCPFLHIVRLLLLQVNSRQVISLVYIIFSCLVTSYRINSVTVHIHVLPLLVFIFCTIFVLVL